MDIIERCAQSQNSGAAAGQNSSHITFTSGEIMEFGSSELEIS